MESQLPRTLVEVQEHLTAALAQEGLPSRRVPQIVAVSKGVGRAALLPFLDGGHKVFAESRVQEAAGKWPELKATYGVTLHLIGPLQTNKVNAAVALFDVIETLDRVKLALAFKELKGRLGRCPRLFVQVNTGEEPQKAGVSPGALEGFVSFCRGESLSIEGLMCLPPRGEAPEKHFSLLARLARGVHVEALSMGMSEDYPMAAACGATQVRVGRALFGGLTKGKKHFMKGL